MASEDLTVRTLTEEDAEAFWSVRLRALREQPEAYGRSYEEERETPLDEIRGRFRAGWKRPTGFVLGAFVDGRLVGIAGVVREAPAKQRHKGYLWGVYVTPEGQGRGIGRRLVTEAIDGARAMPGVELVHLAVGSRSMAARALYISLGFVPFGLERKALKLPDGYVDEEHMVLFLAP